MPSVVIIEKSLIKNLFDTDKASHRIYNWEYASKYNRDPLFGFCESIMCNYHDKNELVIEYGLQSHTSRYLNKVTVEIDQQKNTIKFKCGSCDTIVCDLAKHSITSVSRFTNYSEPGIRSNLYRAVVRNIEAIINYSTLPLEDKVDITDHIDKRFLKDNYKKFIDTRWIV